MFGHSKHQLWPFRYISKCLVGKRSLRLVILLFFSQLFLITSCFKACTQLFGGILSTHSSYHIHSMFSYGHYPCKHAHCCNFPYINDSEKMIHSSCNHKPLEVYQNNKKVHQKAYWNKSSPPANHWPLTPLQAEAGAAGTCSPWTSEAAGLPGQKGAGIHFSSKHRPTY